MILSYPLLPYLSPPNKSVSLHKFQHFLVLADAE